VDENLRQSQSDLLYRVPLIEQADSAGGEIETVILLYLLFEHQSTPDPWMPLRKLCYMCRIWQRYVDEHPTADGLPPIVPLVLAQVAGGWKVSPQFHDQLLWPKAPQLREALALYQPRFEHALIDLAGIDLHALRGDLIARLTQGLLKVRIVGDDGTIVDWAFPLLAEADRTKIGPDSLLPLYRYLLLVTSLNKQEFRVKLRKSSISSDTTKSFMTLADQLISEGREEGLERGALIGQVQALQRLLGRTVSPASTLTGTTREQLESMIAALEHEVSQGFKRV
jgi:hypothetical protein